MSQHPWAAKFCMQSQLCRAKLHPDLGEPQKRHTSVWSLPKHLHLPLVRLAREVTLEAILVTTLLLAHLAVPSQLLQTLGLDPIRDLQQLKYCERHALYIQNIPQCHQPQGDSLCRNRRCTYRLWAEKVVLPHGCECFFVLVYLAVHQASTTIIAK